ncbi:MAG: c-type cytochrome [Gammaproteobacteria bacterium]
MNRTIISLIALSNIALIAIFSSPVIAADGKAVFEKTCKICHVPGIAGAPKLGDKAVWATRNKKGMDTLVKNAIGGFKGAKGMMPPKGGNPKLSDGDVKAAVKYMLDASK